MYEATGYSQETSRQRAQCDSSAARTKRAPPVERTVPFRMTRVWGTRGADDGGKGRSRRPPEAGNLACEGMTWIIFSVQAGGDTIVS